MKENSKKRTWIKRIAIIFFVVLLLLTFFSNTIMNHSLAQVSTQEVESDTVSSKVRGTGTVEAEDAKEIKLEQSREVTEVLVKEGDEVNAGDVLIKLKEGESSELETANKELKSLKEAYTNQILVEEVDRELVTQAENGGIDYQTASNRLSALSANVSQAKQRADELQKQSDSLDNGSSENAALVKQANAELEQANTELTKAENNFMAYGLSEAEVMELYASAPSQTVIDAKAALDAYMTAKNTVADKTAAVSRAETAAAEEKNRVALELAAAQEDLTAATEEHTKYLESISKVNELKTSYEAIKEKEQEVTELTLKSIGNEIKSEVAGKILSVNVKAGDMASPEVSLITIQDTEKGYTLSFSVTKEQASKVKTGDVASIANSWYFGDTTATLKSIKNDTEQPGKRKLLTFEIKGDVEIGQTMTLSLGEKNRTYDFVVPNSAVREDNNGKFILVIKQKSSPLGNRYIAARVDVEVQAADDSKTAVTGALEGGEYVITTSNKLVNTGDYVRLAK